VTCANVLFLYVTHAMRVPARMQWAKHDNQGRMPQLVMRHMRATTATEKHAAGDADVRIEDRK
jgi:hypothetical protein